MKILWAPNPLSTVVELDEAEKLWLRASIKAEYFEDCLISVHMSLDPEMRTQNGRTSTLEDDVAKAMRRIDFDYLCDDSPRGGRTFDQFLDDRTAYYLKSLSEDHDGDCTCVACSCIKCRTEELLGICTISGLGNHEACKIIGAFGEGRTIDEAVEWLRTYKPVYSFNPRWPEEEWTKHVPRWVEEGKRAYEWMVKYRQEHFNGV